MKKMLRKCVSRITRLSQFEAKKLSFTMQNANLASWLTRDVHIRRINSEEQDRNKGKQFPTKLVAFVSKKIIQEDQFIFTSIGCMKRQCYLQVNKFKKREEKNDTHSNKICTEFVKDNKTITKN